MFLELFRVKRKLRSHTHSRWSSTAGLHCWRIAHTHFGSTEIVKWKPTREQSLSQQQNHVHDSCGIPQTHKQSPRAVMNGEATIVPQQKCPGVCDLRLRVHVIHFAKVRMRLHECV